MSGHQRAVLEELTNELRRSRSATDRFDQAVADALGVNRTDLRCVGVLQSEGRLTAGRLAKATGLSTGAMTAALDRLERSGYARRVRDAQDRRRVLVEATPTINAQTAALYAEHTASAERIYQRYSSEELELLLRFVREGRELNERAADRLEQQSRARQATGGNDLERAGR